MPPKRAAVPTNTFGAGSKALDKLTGRVAPPEPDGAEPGRQEEDPAHAVVLQDRTPALPQDRNTVKRQNANASGVRSDGEGTDDSSTREKVTFYLRPDQVEKLDELVLTYKRRTGRRTNRNALMRLMLDRVDLDFLLDA
jgi:hypothetical protein